MKTVYQDWVYGTGRPVLVAGVRAAWQNEAFGYNLDATDELPCGGWAESWVIRPEDRVVYPTFVGRDMAGRG